MIRWALGYFFRRAWAKPDSRALLLYADMRHGMEPNYGEWPDEFYARILGQEQLEKSVAEIMERRTESAWLN